MKPRDDRASAADTAASEWVMRHDRGLSPAEQDAFLQWLAADPRHAEAMARQRSAWEAFDRLAGLHASVPTAPDPDLLSPRSRAVAARPWLGAIWVAAPLAAAAALALAFLPEQVGAVFSRAPAPVSAEVTARLAPIEERILPDGSVLRLNRGTLLTIDFSSGERRVRLERGEVAFEVAKDAARPFVVAIGGVSVRAVGTAFNLRRAASAVEVIVTEGRVAVTPPGASPAVPVPLLSAGHGALVPLAPAAEPPAVVVLSADDLARRLAWQPRTLTFTDEPIAAILEEFNRRNAVALRLADPALRDLRLSARFRSDNVEGFLRLLASDFGIAYAVNADGEILLRSVK